MSTETIVAIVVALYGAVLSTVLAIHEFAKGRPRIKVLARHGYIYDSSGKASEPVIFIEAVNVGSGKVALTGAGWLNHDRSKQHFVSPYPPDIIPADLEERKKCTVMYACRWFREQASHDKVVGVYFEDQIGKKWIGRVSKKGKKTWLSSTGNGWLLQ